jgi:transposase-like protein
MPQLLNEIDKLGYSAVGRKYGVSDNAVRKWVK